MLRRSPTLCIVPVPSPPRTKRQGLSVIIAGATGNTGSELVTRLVSHKAVTRIVALTRQDISVERWRHHFPNLRTTDALKYLSVVAVDWDRIYRDASKIPSSVLCARPRLVGEDREGELAAAKAAEERRMRAGSGAQSQKEKTIKGGGGNDAEVDFQSERTFAIHAVGNDANLSGPADPTVGCKLNDSANVRGLPSSSSDLKKRHRKRLVKSLLSDQSRGDGGGPLPSSSSASASAAGVGLTHTSRTRIGSSGSSSSSSSSDTDRLLEALDAYEDADLHPLPNLVDIDSNASSYISPDHLITLRERNRIQAICQDPYYRSVFGGHTIAINCLGSHQVYWRRQVTTVDLDYSLAFAKLVKLFNCVAINDAFLQDVTVPSAEDTLRAYGARRSMVREGSVEWGEIRSACFGRIVNVSFNHKENVAAAAAALPSPSTTPVAPVGSSSSSSSGEGVATSVGVKGGAAATQQQASDDELTYFGPEAAATTPAINTANTSTTATTATASRKPLGISSRAAALATAKQRKRDYELRRADAAQLRLWDAAVDKALKGRRLTHHSLHHFAQVSVSGASTRSPLSYFKIHGLCDRAVMGLFDFEEEGKGEGGKPSPSLAAPTSPPPPNYGSACSAPLPSQPQQQPGKGGTQLSPVPLLRPLSVLAPTFNHRCDLTIFRPGLLKRRNAMFAERALAYFSPPLAVNSFADVVVDTVMARYAMVTEGLEAIRTLQIALNKKYKYKTWVLRGGGGAPLLAMGSDAATVSDSPFTSSNEYDEAVDGRKRSAKGGEQQRELLWFERDHESSIRAPPSSSSSSSYPSSSSTVNSGAPPPISLSRARLIEAVMLEKQDIKARLGVSSADLERIAEEMEDAAAGGGYGGAASSMASVSMLGSSSASTFCHVCELRARVGLSSRGVVMEAADIRQAHGRLVGGYGGSVAQQQQQQSSSSSSVASKSSSSWHNLTTPQQEQFCHQS